MVKILKTILKIINTIILSVTVLLAVCVIGMKLMGIQLFTVLSGSMEPAYPTGSLIAVKEIAPEELKVDDVITYRLGPSTVATHRIIEILDSEGDPEFRTKGDANEHPDGGTVLAENIIGTPILTIPEAGYTADKLQSAEGKKMIITVFAVLIAFVFVTDFFIGGKKPKKSDESRD